MKIINFRILTMKRAQQSLTRRGIIYSEFHLSVKKAIKNNHIKYSFTALILLMCLSLSAQNKIWTLQECVDYALEHNLTVKQSVLDAKTAEEEINTARGNFLPNLSGNASQNYNFGSFIGQDGRRISIDSRGNAFGLNTTVTIFNGFQNTNTYRQAKLGLESSQLELDILRDNISLNVVNAYLNISLNKEGFNIAQEQVDLSQNQVDQMVELVNSGVRPKADVLEARAQLASDQERLTSAQNSIDLSLLSLSQLLQIPNNGFDVQEILIELSSATLMRNNPDEIFNYAVENRPEIKGAELDIMNSDYNVKIAQGSFYPSLTFGAGMNTSYQHLQGQEDIRIIIDENNNISTVPNGFGTQLEDNLGYNFGFNLRVPIFNRLQTKVNVSKAEIFKEKSLIRLEEEKQTLRTNIEQAYADAKAALKQYEASSFSVDAQLEAFKNSQQSYNLGVMTSFDFEQTRFRLVDAQSKLINAKYDFVFKIKILDFYLGKSLTE